MSGALWCPCCPSSGRFRGSLLCCTNARRSPMPPAASAPPAVPAPVGWPCLATAAAPAPLTNACRVTGVVCWSGAMHRWGRLWVEIMVWRSGGLRNRHMSAILWAQVRFTCVRPGGGPVGPATGTLPIPGGAPGLTRKAAKHAYPLATCHDGPKDCVILSVSSTWDRLTTQLPSERSGTQSVRITLALAVHRSRASSGSCARSGPVRLGQAAKT